MTPKKDYTRATTWIAIGIITVVFWYNLIRFFI